MLTIFKFKLVQEILFWNEKKQIEYIIQNHHLAAIALSENHTMIFWYKHRGG